MHANGMQPVSKQLLLKNPKFRSLKMPILHNVILRDGQQMTLS